VIRRHPGPSLEPQPEIVEPEEFELFESSEPVRVVTAPPARGTRAPGPLAEYSDHFRDLETARTAAWRALEAGDLVTAERHCQEGAAAFLAAAELARSAS